MISSDTFPIYLPKSNKTFIFFRWKDLLFNQRKPFSSLSYVRKWERDGQNRTVICMSRESSFVLKNLSRIKCKRKYPDLTNESLVIPRTDAQEKVIGLLFSLHSGTGSIDSNSITLVITLFLWIKTTVKGSHWFINISTISKRFND